MKTHRWEDLRKKALKPEEKVEVDLQIADELLAIDLRTMRELLGKTQEEVAEAAKMTQSEISRMERRFDHRLSTLRRLVKALGGELEIVANFGDRRVKLHAADSE
jgi:transcriptional regulator with XRE-family HTH domain